MAWFLKVGARPNRPATRKATVDVVTIYDTDSCQHSEDARMNDVEVSQTALRDTYDVLR